MMKLPLLLQDKKYAGTIVDLIIHQGNKKRRYCWGYTLFPSIVDNLDPLLEHLSSAIYNQTYIVNVFEQKVILQGDIINTDCAIIGVNKEQHILKIAYIKNERLKIINVSAEIYITHASKGYSDVSQGFFAFNSIYLV